MRKACCLLAGAVLAGAGLGGGLAHAETLDQVLIGAYESNPTILARQARVRATDEMMPQAMANWRPTVKWAGDVGRGRYESNTATVREQGRSEKTSTFTITQPIFRGGRTLAEMGQAEETVMSERAQLIGSVQTILLNAATAYLNVVRDDQVVRLNVNNQQILQRQLEAAQERFRVGEITRTDVSQAESRLAQSVADRVQAEGVLQNSRANFLNIVGRPPEALEPVAPLANLPVDLGEVVTIAREKHPNVVSAVHSAKAAQEGVDLVRGELLPTLSFTGQHIRSLAASSQGSESETLEGMLTLTVPLYQAGDVYSRLRAQKHTVGQRQIEIDMMARDAVEAATRAWDDLQAARARIKSFEAQIAASEMALAGVEEEARVGSRTVLEVLDAEQELFTSRVNLVRAKHDELLAGFQMKTALGQMTPEGLALATQSYDPAKHYDDVKNKWFGGSIDKGAGYQ